MTKPLKASPLAKNSHLSSSLPTKKSPLQGNQPGDDPNKYGLKFDGGKARWDLIAMKELMEIIRIPQTIINKSNVAYVGEYNEHEIYNIIMTVFSEWIDAKDDYMRARFPEIIKPLPYVGFQLFKLLRGKGYIDPELKRCEDHYRWDLFDVNDLQKIADVYSYGAKLYAPNNWQNVDTDRYISAFYRHFKTVRTKARFDDETGCLHLHQAIWNIITLMWKENHGQSMCRVS